MKNEKLKKIDADIVKIEAKMADFAARLRELKRQKTEIENAGIIALVRDMDILPDELTAFIQAFKTQSDNGTILPMVLAEVEPQNENKEDAHEEK